MQGAHQVAQKLTKAGLDRSIFCSNKSVPSEILSGFLFGFVHSFAAETGKTGNKPNKKYK